MNHRSFVWRYGKPIALIREKIKILLYSCHRKSENMFKKNVHLVLILTLILSGCSLVTQTLGGENSKEKKEEKPGIEDFKATTGVKGILREGPGILSVL